MEFRLKNFLIRQRASLVLISSLSVNKLLSIESRTILKLKLKEISNLMSLCGREVLSKMPVTSYEPDEIPNVDMRGLTKDDFDVALKNVSASISEDTTASQAIRKWNETFGTKGSLGKKMKLSYYT
ncbi:hypothetical protein GEMRC1_005716 [Eukaryota sp. GEM-RC1]